MECAFDLMDYDGPDGFNLVDDTDSLQVILDAVAANDAGDISSAPSNAPMESGVDWVSTVSPEVETEIANSGRVTYLESASVPPSIARRAIGAYHSSRGGDSMQRKRKPTRQLKRRDEIIHLRDKIKEMETQLAALQNRKLDGDDMASSLTIDIDAALVGMWQDIANRQQRLRHKAELEQAKLRAQVKRQMKVAHGLTKFIQKARLIENDEAFLTAGLNGALPDL